MNTVLMLLGLCSSMVKNSHQRRSINDYNYIEMEMENPFRKHPRYKKVAAQTSVWWGGCVTVVIMPHYRLDGY